MYAFLSHHTICSSKKSTCWILDWMQRQWDRNLFITSRDFVWTAKPTPSSTLLMVWGGISIVKLYVKDNNNLMAYAYLDKIPNTHIIPYISAIGQISYLYVSAIGQISYNWTYAENAHTGNTTTNILI